MMMSVTLNYYLRLEERWCHVRWEDSNTHSLMDLLGHCCSGRALFLPAESGVAGLSLNIENRGHHPMDLVEGFIFPLWWVLPSLTHIAVETPLHVPNLTPWTSEEWCELNGQIPVWLIDPLRSCPGGGWDGWGPKCLLERSTMLWEEAPFMAC